MMLLMQQLSLDNYQYLQSIKTNIGANLTATSLPARIYMCPIRSPFVLHPAEIGLFFRSRECDTPGLIQLIYNNRRYGP